MILSMLAMMQAVAAPVPAAPQGDGEKTIVVVGRRLADTERALAACIARQCPPKEEIDASLAHAENQFLAGDYPASRRTLLAARKRNAKYAKDLPIDVSDLLRANSRLAILNGMPTAGRINTIDTLDVLKGGLPADDPRVLMQRLSVGDVFAKQGRFEASRDIYGTVEKQAHKAGLPMVEGLAMLRTAVQYTALAAVDARYKDSAKAAIARIRATTDPALAPFRDSMPTLERNVALGGKVHDAEKAMLAKTPSAERVNRAILVYAPPIKLADQSRSNSTTVFVGGDDTPQWIDVAFWIAPDGSVRDIDVARQSDNAKGQWIELVKKALAGRLYRPLALGANDPGLRRIERYSLFYDRAFATGSRVSTRSPLPNIEVTDLTVDTPTG